MQIAHMICGHKASCVSKRWISTHRFQHAALCAIKASGGSVFPVRPGLLLYPELPWTSKVRRKLPAAFGSRTNSWNCLRRNTHEISQRGSVCIGTFAQDGCSKLKGKESVAWLIQNSNTHEAMSCSNYMKSQISLGEPHSIEGHHRPALIVGWQGFQDLRPPSRQSNNGSAKK